MTDTTYRIKHPPTPSRGLTWTDDDWMIDGACREEAVGVALFFRERQASVERAKALCVRCVVSTECLLFAMRNREVGIWGGTTDEDRDRIRRRRSGRLL